MYSGASVNENQDIKALRAEIERLRAQLKEAEEVLGAIRGGEVDALVITSSEQVRDSVYTLVGSDGPYQRLVEAMQEGAVTLARDGMVLYSNPSFARMMRSRYDSIVGASFSRFVAPADASRFQAFLDQQGDGKAEMTLVAADSSQVPVYLSRSAADLVGIQGICLTVTDLTDQKKHDEVVTSERLARSILEQAAETIVVCDEHGRITHASRQASVLCGQNPLLKRFDEVYHLTFNSSLSVPPSDGEDKYLLKVARGESSVVGREVTCTRADGECFHLMMSSSPLRGKDGQVLGAVIILTDVTESKRAAEAVKESERQLRALNETLEERVVERTSELSRANVVLSQKNRELQDFAYVASHDLQEPLRKIAYFTELLDEEYTGRLDGDGSFYLERIRKSAIRMTELIRALLNFSRIVTHGNPIQEVDLNTVLADVLSDLDIKLSELGGQVISSNLPTLQADPVQMRQLLQNLISNALKFSWDGQPSTVHIRGWIERRDPDTFPSEQVRLEVEDDGIGFDEKYLDRIFSPFQRLHRKNEYPGTGMGLAICRRIAERHGGSITAHSTPGKGSVFVVTLPLLSAPVDDEEGGT
jgi:PAS domain S-box-containing protein